MRLIGILLRRRRRGGELLRLGTAAEDALRQVGVVEADELRPPPNTLPLLHQHRTDHRPLRRAHLAARRRLERAVGEDRHDKLLALGLRGLDCWGVRAGDEDHRKGDEGNEGKEKS
jgi:hypothetical protein